VATGSIRRPGRKGGLQEVENIYQQSSGRTCIYKEIRQCPYHINDLEDMACWSATFAWER
jgi:hypothetical protein